MVLKRLLALATPRDPDGYGHADKDSYQKGGDMHMHKSYHFQGVLLGAFARWLRSRREARIECWRI